MLNSRTATPKQVAANQSNSHKSTGPKTPEGKRKSSQNGSSKVYYGFVSRPGVAATLHEDPTLRLRYYNAYLRSYPPESDAY